MDGRQHALTPSLGSRPTLGGARVILRPATGDDAAPLGQLMQDPEIGRLTVGEVVLNDACTQAARWVAESPDGRLATYGLVTRAVAPR